MRSTGKGTSVPNHILNLKSEGWWNDADEYLLFLVKSQKIFLTDSEVLLFSAPDISSRLWSSSPLGEIPSNLDGLITFTQHQIRHSSQNFVDSLWWLVVKQGTSNLCTSVQDTQTGSRSLISNLRNPTIVQNCKLTRHVFIALYGDIGWEKSISVSVFFIRLVHLICFIGCGDNVIYEGATKFMERKKNSAYTNTSWGH